MDKIAGKVKAAIGKKEDNFGQPGDGVERSADSSVNDKVNQFADNAGLPQGDNGILDKVVDNKVNSDIPGGN